MKKLFILLALIALAAGCGQRGKGIVCDFEKTKIWDTSPDTGVGVELSTDYVTEGKHSLKITYPRGDYPSINSRHLLHHWGDDYTALLLDVYNPQPNDIRFTMRLDDVSRRRVNLEMTLKPGWNHLSIPKQRIGKNIDASVISFVVLFVEHPKEPVVLYFDGLRVQRSGDRDQGIGDRGQGIGNRVKGVGDRVQGVGKEGREQKIAPLAEPVNELFETMHYENPFPAEGYVEAQAVKLDDAVTDVWVSTGIPFAPGQLTDEKMFSVHVGKDEELPVGVKVLARWPQDGSIRSLLVQFPLTIEHRYKPLYVGWGKPRMSADLLLRPVGEGVPQGYLVMPAQWLCASGIVGEQVPSDESGYPRYEQHMRDGFKNVIKTPNKDELRDYGYYDVTHVYYQLYARTGDPQYFAAARQEALRYRVNIVTEGEDRGRYREYSQPRYVYVQGMLDDYLFTGDETSLRLAGYMAEYLKKICPPEKAFYERTRENFWTERFIAFPLIGMMTYYGATGDKEYLDACAGIVKNLYRTQLQWPDKGGFIHNLYAHDPEEGARPDEYGGSPFMTGLLLEGIIEYHRMTGSTVAKDSIFRALDWLMNECVSSDGDSFVYTTADAKRDESHPDLNMLIVHAFGYGYKISNGTRGDYLDIGKYMFESGIEHAFLGSSKHFNQNYRSSGHFLAYVRSRD